MIDSIFYQQWLKVINQAKQEFSYLERLCLESTNSNTSPETIPDFLKLSTMIGVRINDSYPAISKLAMVGPEWDTGVLWTAIGIALGLMKREYDITACNMPSIKRGQKVRIEGEFDKGVYEYDGIENGQIWVKGSDGRIGRPEGYILQIKPIDSQRPLSRVYQLGSPSLVCLDHLLNIKTYGARHIFNTQLILVSQLSSILNQIKHTSISTDSTNKTRVHDLFQWGRINSEGEVSSISSGQMSADPVILVASDLFSVRSYLEKKHNQDIHFPLILCDGARTFINSLQPLDDILQGKYSLIVYVNKQEEERKTDLISRGFNVWNWTSSEIKCIMLNERREAYNISSGVKELIFSSIRKKLDNYSNYNLTTNLCHLPELENIINRMLSLVDSLDDESFAILRKSIYNCLLSVVQLLHPYKIDEPIYWKNILQLCSSYLKKEKQWLTNEDYNNANSLLELLSAVANKAAVIKQEALFNIIAMSSEQTLLVVLGKGVEIEPIEQFWKEYLTGTSKHVLFCSINDYTVKSKEMDVTHIVICGWIGAQQVHKLISSYLVPNVTFLFYPFEEKWYRKAMNRWYSNKGNIDSIYKTQILRIKDFVLIDEDLEQKADNKQEEGKSAATHLADPITQAKTPLPLDDIEEFELHLYRRARLPSISQDVPFVDTCSIDFSNGYYAYFTNSFYVVVITDIISQYASDKKDERSRIPEISRKTIDDLYIGDYIAFREGATTDLIREIADTVLQKEGRQEDRKNASLWRKALENYMKRYNILSYNVLTEQMKEKGISRNVTTIRKWLLTDEVIGPDDYKDSISKIAKFTQDSELRARTAEVIESIKIVKSAHSKATHILAAQLYEKFSHSLAYLNAGAFYDQDNDLIIEEVGKIKILQIENIANAYQKTPKSYVNVLCHE